MATRNSEVLADFVAYCEANPTMRFWQALRNWSGFSSILAEPVNRKWPGEMMDTFYWEGRGPTTYGEELRKSPAGCGDFS